MIYLPLQTVKYIQERFEENLKGHNLVWHTIDEFSKVVIIDDALVLLMEIANVEDVYFFDVIELHLPSENTANQIAKKGNNYYELHIEELTYNSIKFQYNHSALIRKLNKELNTKAIGLFGNFTYTKFRGYTRLYWCPDKEMPIEYIDKLLPEIHLRERYEKWEGIQYYFIVMEMQNSFGDIEYAVAYTTLKPNIYINSRCREWLKYGLKGGDFRTKQQSFYNAFNSWKGTSRVKRLENYFSYFYLEHFFREKDDAWRYADKILKNVYNGYYKQETRSTYNKPINKWISEETVYNIVKKLYKDYKVIYQYRPFFLKSEKGGQMSYDVFIPILNVAIEYQGKQHFEPVEYFGGEEAFKELIKRDEIKKYLSEKNGIKLVYISYLETISPKLVKDKINQIIDF